MSVVLRKWRPAEFRALATRALRSPIPHAPANEVTNCHGWVFTAAGIWLAPEDSKTS